MDSVVHTYGLGSAKPRDRTRPLVAGGLTRGGFPRPTNYWDPDDGRFAVLVNITPPLAVKNLHSSVMHHSLRRIAKSALPRWQLQQALAPGVVCEGPSRLHMSTLSNPGPNKDGPKPLLPKELTQLAEENKMAYIAAMEFYKKDMPTLVRWLDLSPVKHHGRVHAPDYMPLPTTNQQCIPFPLDTQVTTLQQESMTLNDMTPVLSGTGGENDRGLRLYTFACKQWGAELANSWLQAFLASDLVDKIPAVHLNIVEWGFLGIVKGTFIKSMREKKIPKERWHLTAYAFGGLMEFATKLLLPNKFTGYAYLVDNAGRVRWRACGKAQPQDVERMLAIANMLLKEQQNDFSNRSKAGAAAAGTGASKGKR